MNDFDQQIKEARQRRRWRYGLTIVLLGLCMGLYISWLLVITTYHLTVLPKEIEDTYTISLKKGHGFFIDNTLYLLSDHALLDIQAPEFITENLHIHPDTTRAIKVILKPKPATLIGTTEPMHPDIQWSINGSVVHQGPSLKQALAAGKHTLTITHKHYKTIEETIELQRAQRYTKVWALTPTAPVTAAEPLAPAPTTATQTHQTKPSTKKPKPPSESLPVKKLLFSVDDLGIMMRRFTPRRFTMGSPPNEKGRQRNEFPLVVDFTRSLYVSLHEITEAQYAAFNASVTASNLPVSNISWLDAIRYCNWLSQQEGRPIFYQINKGKVTGVNPNSTGYRLLTEAEWEWLAKQARRATATRFIWGNDERIPANSMNIADQTIHHRRTFAFKNYQDGFAEKAPVGSFPPDRLGLYDLSGNVSEWVHDLYTNYPPNLNQVAVNYLGPARGIGHLVKGGHYQTGRFAELRGAYKQVSLHAEPTIGFRIARYGQ